MEEDEERAAQEAPAEEESPFEIQEIKLEALVEAVESAIKAGKTPLVIDRSEAHNVDTFFSYQGGAVILSGKKMTVEKSKDKKPVPEILENARKDLVAAMKGGKQLVICCENSVLDFATTFVD